MYHRSLCVSKIRPKDLFGVSLVVDGSVYHSDTIDWDKPTVFPTDPTKVGYALYMLFYELIKRNIRKNKKS